MLARIDLQLFKCFKLMEISLQPLTLLSGGNASGKSTVMQALALLHQTMNEHEWSSRLALNGQTVCLGNSEDIIDDVHGRHYCGMSLHDADATSIDWTFRREGSELSLAVQKVSVCDADSERLNWNAGSDEPLQCLVPVAVGQQSRRLISSVRRLTYLTAERLGPREYHPVADSRSSLNVGARGERAVGILFSRGEKRILGKMAVDNVPANLGRQVEARMSQFFPGCVLTISPVDGTNTLTLRIRTEEASNFHRTVNAGFGLTQILPIIVAVLSAAEGDVLLIENPEVHLHPAAQGAMGRFLALAASAGIQVVLETHSDHVLNGIRCAVKTGVLSHEHSAFYFFTRRNEAAAKGVSQVEGMLVNSKGKLDFWPMGFFDQIDNDVNYLAEWC